MRAPAHGRQFRLSLAASLRCGDILSAAGQPNSLANYSAAAFDNSVHRLVTVSCLEGHCDTEVIGVPGASVMVASDYAESVETICGK